jgi:hypothetical protein
MMTMNENSQTPSRRYYIPHHLRRRHLPNRPSITCALCKSVTYFEQKNDLERLKRKKKKRQSRELTPDFCAVHKTEHIMFCLKTMQLMCPECLLSNEHRYHKDDDHKVCILHICSSFFSQYSSLSLSLYIYITNRKHVVFHK